MTTKYTYKYYDVFTLEHQGEFPHVLWESEPIDLYGCPKVTTKIQIYPNGDTRAKGTLSAYVLFNSTDPNITLEAAIGIQINNQAQGIRGGEVILTPFLIGKDTQSPFGQRQGRGWANLCEIGEVFKEPKTTVQYVVKVS